MVESLIAANTMKHLNTKYGLNNRIMLDQIDEGHIAIIKKIKSRIIQKDAIKIVEVAKVIWQKDPGFKVSLVCSDNICSKSLALLKEQGVGVII